MRKSPKIASIVFYIAFAVLAVLCFEYAILRVHKGNNPALSYWAMLPLLTLVCAFLLTTVNKRMNWLHPFALTAVAVVIGVCFGMNQDAIVLGFFAIYILLASYVGAGAASLLKQWKETKNTDQ